MRCHACHHVDPQAHPGLVEFVLPEPVTLASAIQRFQFVESCQ